MKTFIETIAKEAGKLALSYFGREIKHSNKADNSIVTEADIAVEHFLKKKIKEKYPDHGFITEEADNEKIDAEYVWIIDPIDGTTNFSRGHPSWAVSIALAKNKEVIAGVIYAPVLDELYAAEKGKGATCNGKNVRASVVSKVREAMVHCGVPPLKNIDKEEVKKHLCNAIDNTNKVRITGAATICCANIAAGKADAYYTDDIKIWDIAAGALLIQEAGGKVTDFAGNQLTLDVHNTVCSNGLIHDEIMEKIVHRK